MIQRQTPLNIEQLWSEGIHVSSTGQEYNIADMPVKYLQNVINKFGSQGYDVSILESAIATMTGTDNPVPDAGSSALPVVNITQ